MLALKASRRPGTSTFNRLAETVRSVQAVGGRVYLETAADGTPIIPPWAREQGGADYSATDFATIRWGQTITAEGRVFREIVSVSPSTRAR
jgi:hypothetical protein